MIDDGLYDARRQRNHADQSERHDAADMTECVTGHRRADGTSCANKNKNHIIASRI